MRGNRDIYIILGLTIGAAITIAAIIITETPWTFVFAWIGDLQK